MATAAKLVTVEEYSQLPDPPAGHYELHHGEVVLVTGPKWGHQRLQDRIVTLLKAKLGGEAYVTLEMCYRPEVEYEVWEADVAVVLIERANAVEDDEYLDGAPDMVIEVVSPSNTADEIEDKRLLCLVNGCQSFWVVYPKRKSITVSTGSETRTYGLSDVIYSGSPLPFEIAVREVFPQ